VVAVSACHNKIYRSDEVAQFVNAKSILLAFNRIVRIEKYGRALVLFQSVCLVCCGLVMLYAVATTHCCSGSRFQLSSHLTSATTPFLPSLVRPFASSLLTLTVTSLSYHLLINGEHTAAYVCAADTAAQRKMDSHSHRS
jgi:hypothetical protein